MNTQSNDKQKDGESRPLEGIVRATCNCSKDVKLNSYEGKDMPSVEVPETVTLRYNSPDREKRETVCIDACIIPEIKYLWSLCIETMGCCCGHHLDHGYVFVHEDDIGRMENLRYKHYRLPDDNGRNDRFYLKTIELL